MTSVDEKRGRRRRGGVGFRSPMHKENASGMTKLKKTEVAVDDDEAW